MKLVDDHLLTCICMYVFSATFTNETSIYSNVSKSNQPSHEKVRSTTVWDDPSSPACANPTSTPVATMCKDVAALNLSRYVDEIVAAILEVLAAPKTKLVDVPGIALVCSAMHERYADFCPALVAGLVATIRSIGGGGGGSGKKGGGVGGDGGAAGSPKHRRVCMRLLTEFVLLGMMQGQDVKAMVKSISEASGAPPSSEVAAAVEDATDDGGEGNVDQEALQAGLYPKYNVQDANMVVGFARAAALEVAGYVPRTVREAMDALQKEIDQSKAAESRLQSKKQQSADAAAGDQNGALDTAVSGDAAVQAEELVDEDEYSVVSAPLLQKAIDAIEAARATSASFASADSNSIAVSPHPSMLIRMHLRATHYQLSTTLVTTHARLLKLEKRCEADRLLQGQLSEAREKGLANAQKLVENLTKWVEGLAESLDLDVPTLAKEEEDEDLDAGTRGIELLGKDTEEGGDLGPYDDPETKSFYTDIPDLLTTLPATLLGMSTEEVERKKVENERKYGGNGEADDMEGDVAAPDVDESAADTFEEADDSGAKDDSGTNQGADNEENKDAPHYKLQVLLEEELPECHNRTQIDAIAEKFCSNHATSKTARKRLSRTLFLVPRVRLDLLPYYSRLAAIMDRVFSDVSAPLVKELEAQFHGQARWKKQQHLESRLKTARFLGELTKFQVAPPIVVMRSLRRCFDDFSGYNIDVACALLESCGRYLYKSPHTRSRMSSLLDTMMRIKKAKNLDERSISIINSAMYLVNPPQTTARKDVKVLPPMEAYLKELFMVRLSPEADSVKLVSKQVQRLPWSDPTQECGYLVVKYMLKACRKGRYKAVGAVTAVAANLKRTKPEVPSRLADTVLEELQWVLDHPSVRDQQRTIVFARILGEMLHSGLVPTSLVFDELYKFINLGHEIPPALRESSEKYAAAQAEGSATTVAAVSSSSSTPMPKFMAAGGDVSQAIAEDEEVDEDDDDEGGDGSGEQNNADGEEQPDEEPARPAVVAVSNYSVFDPRVPTPFDPPNSPFRISLVCTVLETSSSALVTSGNKAKLGAFLAAFQRYLFTKDTLPTEVEFNLLDVFDVLDSVWKEKSRSSKRRQSRQESSAGFTRYPTWLEAHNATVTIEEAQALSKERAEARLLAQARVVPAGDASLAGTAELDELDELDDEMAIVSDDEGDEVSVDDDGSLRSADDMSLGSEGSGDDSDMEDDDDDNLSGQEDDDEESSDGDSDDGVDEEVEKAAAEEAHMRQMEDDAFERELRRLTMDALEKGKVTSRSAGGKVSDTMPVASQLVIKKPSASSPATGPDIPVAPNNTAPTPMALAGPQAMSFQLLKKGHKGKAETKELYIPTDTNLVRAANKQDDEAARERDILKEQVLRYAAESAEQDAAGGNVYMEQSKLQKIRNRPLTNEAIDNAFGSSNRRRQQGQDQGAGRGGSSSGRVPFYSGRGRGGGRGPPGRGAGRLFNPGSYGRPNPRDDDDF